MVSFWPWKGDDNSPAGFEKTLSTLSAKIAQSTTRLDQQRQRARRFQALWTLYSTFAYLFYSIILALVVGWETWGVKEFAAIAGGPVLIYAVRTMITRIFDYRISRTQRHVDELNKQRDTTIEKLKVATKYNSTQQLLEKYGGESPKTTPKFKTDSPDSRRDASRSQQQQQQQGARTGLPPPPTANIRRPAPSSPQARSFPSPDAPSSPIPFQTPQQAQPSLPSSPSPFPSVQQMTDDPGFAPNAFSNSGQYIEQSHWYDRLLDVLLGEDETQPRNRMAMICSSCRLVNGQAPPGIKTLEELGRWKCGSCGAWNGEESETTQLLSSLRNNVGSDPALGESVIISDKDVRGSEPSDDEVVVTAWSGEEDNSHLEVTEPEDRTGEVSRPGSVRRSKRGRGKQED
ncbi:hypothetical protein N7539_008881 [Penicillium diatomitis]|uniref:Endoplasmic reticulum junction formation protein lunapark n=1 Tax=Penicillium diatomitis TaxID=2819901 RepID=A0A9W9WLB4_9EURO|nr:uncharacterized protein N7539_008881 [Penicillium diatomitis]KAJ5469263.1 hypothetical protein N7539_008881 [Penicillium diatomitis]